MWKGLPRVTKPRIHRRWPSAAITLGALVTCLIVWRVGTARSMPSSPLTGVPIRVDRVIDGDTLLLQGNHRVRLLGVNTPETMHPDRPAEPLGLAATEYTRSLVEGKTITLEFDRERLDNYRRVLAYVYLSDGSLLNQRLIEAGMSPAVVSFPIRSDRRRLFQEAELAAQQSLIGIWSLPEWQVRMAEQRTRADRRQ